MNRLLCLCAVSSALLINPVFAMEAGHDHSAGQPATLQLNAGKQWETDAPLRQSMTEMRQSFADNLNAIHAKQLALPEYNALAQSVERSVARIVAQCKLPPAADAQLHIIVAELISGSQLMADQSSVETARSGAVKVVGALNRYGQYFNDPGFKPLGH